MSRWHRAEQEARNRRVLAGGASFGASEFSEASVSSYDSSAGHWRDARIVRIGATDNGQATELASAFDKHLSVRSAKFVSLDFR
jgi:hypothetical protein